MKKPIEACYRMFGVRVEAVRTAMGWSQQELADKVALARASISNIEAGKQRVLLADVERFAAAFGVSPKHLLCGLWT